MGGSNVIAEVGLSVVNVFRRNMTPEPIASPESIGLCSPQEPDDFQLTVWIYNMEEQKTAGSVSSFLPDPSNPALERFSPMQIKLYLLVTAHSKAPTLIRADNEYRILGRAVQVVRDMPVIDSSYLEGSLLSGGTNLTLEILKLSSDELSKIWNSSSKPIKMSFGLSVSVALESTLVRTIPPHVVEAHIGITQKS